MIETWQQQLPNGIQLSCRAAGAKGRPVLMFLHGFPEAAFVWDDMLLHFSQPAQGGYRCVAPNLRGFEKSSQPTDVSAYRANILVQDMVELIHLESAAGPLQAAQALSANQFEMLFGFIEKGLTPTWLTPQLKEQYRQAWAHGIQGGLNYYCASPLKPDPSGLPHTGDLEKLVLPDEMFRISMPTLLIWGMQDVALLHSLNVGLDANIPQLKYVPIENGSHWVVHEHPEVVQREIASFL